MEGFLSPVFLTPASKGLEELSPLSSKGQILAEEKGSTKRRKEQPKNNSEALGQGLGSTSRDTYNNVTILHTRQGQPEATLKEPEKLIRKIN